MSFLENLVKPDNNSPKNQRPSKQDSTIDLKLRLKGNITDGLNSWRLSDELSVSDAALLVISCDPSKYSSQLWYKSQSEQPPNYHAVFSAMKNAILRKRLKANIQFIAHYINSLYECTPGEHFAIDQHSKKVTVQDEPDWSKTTVHVNDLKKWLVSRGFESGFFFPEAANNYPDYLDPTHNHFAPKLAAAINAWIEVSANKELTKGKTVKQAIEIWLRQNAGNYGFTDDDGNPTKSAVEDIAKVTNWDTKGGAPKTPVI